MIIFATAQFQFCFGRKLEEAFEDFALVRPEKCRSVLLDDVAEVLLSKIDDELAPAILDPVNGWIFDVGVGIFVGIDELLVAIHFRVAEETSRCCLRDVGRSSVIFVAAEQTIHS
jgi:hypothetical protein